jgi:hypothetical protein
MHLLNDSIARHVFRVGGEHCLESTRKLPESPIFASGLSDAP